MSQSKRSSLASMQLGVADASARNISAFSKSMLTAAPVMPTASFRGAPVLNRSTLGGQQSFVSGPAVTSVADRTTQFVYEDDMLPQDTSFDSSALDAILRLDQTSIKPFIDFGVVEIGESTTVVLRVQNPTKDPQNIAIERVPTEYGFSTREVDFVIPQHSMDYLIPICWEPKKEGATRREMVFLWHHPVHKRRMPVVLFGFGQEPGGSNMSKIDSSTMYLRKGKVLDTTVLESENANTQKVSSFSKARAKQTRAPLKAINSNIAGERQYRLNTTIDVRKKRRQDDAMQKKMKSPTKEERDMKEAQLAADLAEQERKILLELQQKNRIAEQIRQEQMKQRRWLDALPVDTEQLTEEIQYVKMTKRNRCSDEQRRRSSQGLQRTIAYFNCEKISLLLTWTQLICGTYGVPVENFTSSFAPRDREAKIFTLLTNFYRPNPLSLNELFPEELERWRLQQLEDEEDDAYWKEMDRQMEEKGHWSGSIPAMTSRKRIKLMIAIEDENKIPEERTIISKVADICGKLLKTRRKAELWGQLIKVQAAVRGFLARQYVKRELNIIRRTQETVRRNAYAKLDREWFLSIRASAISLQAFVRAQQAQEAYQCLNQQATLIQRQYLSSAQRKRFLLAKQGIVSLQSLARIQALQHTSERERKSTVLLQSCSHALQVSSDLIHLQNAVTLLQSLARCGNNVQDMIRSQQCSTALQTQARAQHTWRQFDERVECMAKCQSIYRMNSVANNLRQEQHAALIIQCRYKGKQVTTQIKSGFEKTRGAAVLLQSVARTAPCLGDFQAATSSAVLLQSSHRVESQEDQFSGLANAAVCLQSLCRSAFASDRIDSEFNKITKCQATVKMYLEKKRYAQYRSSSTLLQSLERSAQGAAVFDVLCTAATLYQQRFRAKLAMVMARKHFEQLKCGGLFMQVSSRRNDCSTEFDSLSAASVLLQQQQRQSSAMTSFDQCRSAIVSLQSTLRTNNAMQEFNGRLRNIVMCQALGRAKQNSNEFVIASAAATIFQRRWRARQVALAARSKYQHGKERISQLQSLIKLQLVSAEFDENRKSIISIQGFARSNVTLFEYVHQSYTAAVIQERFRSRQIMLSTRDTFLRTKDAISSLQSLVRSQAAMAIRVNDNAAATAIQSTWRMFAVRRRYIAYRNSVIAIQASIKGCIARKNYAQSIASVEHCQSIVSMQLAMAKHNQRVVSSTTLQCLSRQQDDKHNFDVAVKSAVSCQSAARTTQIAGAFDGARAAVSLLQSLTRADKEYQSFDKDMSRVAKCQAIVRARIERKRHIDRVSKIESLQALVLCQARVTNYEAEAEYMRTFPYRANLAAIKIQKVFRGYHVRKLNAEQVNEINRRLARLAETMDESRRLGDRTRSALNVLKTSTRMKEITEAIENLATTTKYSIKCCESLAKENAVPIVVHFVQSLNRSEPHRVLLRHSLGILLNLSKTAYTASSVFDSDAIAIVIEKMQSFRDSEDIFILALQILQKLCESNERLKKLRESQQFLRSLKGISQAMEEKHKADRQFCETMAQQQRRQAMYANMTGQSVQWSRTDRMRYERYMVVQNYHNRLNQFIAMVENSGPRRRSTGTRL